MTSNWRLITCLYRLGHRVSLHVDSNALKYRDRTSGMLRQHDKFNPKVNDPRKVQDILIPTGLARSEKTLGEKSPSDTSCLTAHLTVLDTITQFKRRTGTTSDGDLNSEFINQLGDYLTQSTSQRRVQMGVLVDSRCWLLCWFEAGDLRLTRPNSINGHLPPAETLPALAGQTWRAVEGLGAVDQGMATMGLRKREGM